MKEYFEIVQSEIIPTRKIPEITDEPIIWRYFVAPLKSVLASMQLDEKEFVARIVMKINTELKGAYVFSSGKNMGTFKAVGYPEDVGKFYKLETFLYIFYIIHIPFLLIVHIYASYFKYFLSKCYFLIYLSEFL